MGTAGFLQKNNGKESWGGGEREREKQELQIKRDLRD